MASSTTTDGPVLNLINKRLRALRKKLNRITSMEESVAQGKPLNKEQEEVLRSKSSVLALIDEFEKLRQPLSSALAEELDLATQNNRETLPENSERRSDDVVEDILNLLYFGSLFEVKTQNDFHSTMLTRTHERGCCLTYDYVTDDATDLLGEKDLDSISALFGLLISRPADSSFSHKNALRRCIEHAKLWVSKAQQPIDPNVDVTYAGLREKLNKIMSSEYFTTTPEMKATVEVAAAAGNYGAFQVPAHGSVVSVEVEGSDSQPEEKV
ncbi:keratin type I cytoskeletal 10-like [Trifolium pratense]|uniref:Keratin type I cytoskeletal 10-like n=1 Tax=Trifolium pratense TaxID=57577 RepID=A0A2K3LID0_TRIPR|nr:keratin type I cytoskeletal 10-like [Trifolium pratense]